MSCYKERDYEQSKTYNKELLSISKELGNKKMEAKASNFLTWLNSELEKCQQSKEYGEESLSIAKGVKDKNLKAEACGGKGKNILETLVSYSLINGRVHEWSFR